MVILFYIICIDYFFYEYSFYAHKTKYLHDRSGVMWFVFQIQLPSIQNNEETGEEKRTISISNRPKPTANNQQQFIHPGNLKNRRNPLQENRIKNTSHLDRPQKPFLK